MGHGSLPAMTSLDRDQNSMRQPETRESQCMGVEMAREIAGCAFLLLLALLAPTGRAVVVRVQPSDIEDARLGCEYRLTCELGGVTSPLLWLRSNMEVMNGQDDITVTEMDLGGGVRRTELIFNPLVMSQLGRYECLEPNSITSFQARIEAPADSRPIEISVAGADVKNISAFRVNEVRDVGCTVDSCLTSQYTVRFLSPSGTELLTETSSSMMMTFNWQASITRDITGGNYTCEVLVGGSNDSAVFSFVGTPQDGPTEQPPVLPCPTPDRAWPTSISVVVCFTSFLLVVWLR